MARVRIRETSVRRQLEQIILRPGVEGYVSRRNEIAQVSFTMRCNGLSVIVQVPESGNFPKIRRGLELGFRARPRPNSKHRSISCCTLFINST